MSLTRIRRVLAAVGTSALVSCASSPTDELYWAAYSGDVPKVQQAFARGGSLTNNPGVSWWSPPVFSAASMNQVEVLRWLLRNGGYVAEPIRGDTVLTLAAMHGSTEAVEELVTFGADMCVRRGGTPGYSRVKSAKRFGDSALSLAIEDGNVRMVQALAKSGNCLDWRSTNGGSLVSQAVRSGQPEIVAALLGAGAPPDFVGSTDEPPLVEAVSRGHLGITRQLLTAGAGVEVRSKLGFTPLMFAAGSGNAEVVDALLKRGADIAADRAGMKPADFAVIAGHIGLAYKIDPKVDIRVGQQVASALRPPVVVDKPSVWWEFLAAALGGYASAMQTLPPVPARSSSVKPLPSPPPLGAKNCVARAIVDGGVTRWVQVCE